MSQLITNTDYFNVKVKKEMDKETEITDFKIETTPTSIPILEIVNSTKGNIPNNLHSTLFNNTDDRNPDSKLNDTRVIKTEITDFGIDLTPTTVQNFTQETKIELTQSQTQIKAEVLQETNEDAESKLDLKIKTNQGTIQDVANETENISSKKRTHKEQVEVDPTSNAVQMKDTDSPLEKPQEDIEQQKKEDKRIKVQSQSKHKPFKCNVCNTLKACLKKHKKTHNGENPYKCNMCDNKFITKVNLKCHHSKSHARIRSLETHNISHSEDQREKNYPARSLDKPYSCRVCTKRFVLKINLEKHEIVHSKDKPYECNVCNRKYTRYVGLRDHKNKAHRGYTPYKCNMCPKIFSTNRSLKFHQACHFDKPFVCNVCDKRFRLEVYLKRHEKLHTEGKPYVCNLCNKKYASKHSLKRHERVHAKCVKKDLLEVMV